MSSTALFVSSLFYLVSGEAFFLVGRAIMKRRVEGEGRLALFGFMCWWYGLAVVEFLIAGITFAGALGIADVNLYLAMIQIVIVLIFLAAWGLAYYFFFLFTGRQILVPLAIVYGFVTFLTLYLIAGSHIESVTIGSSEVTPNYGNKEFITPFWSGVLAFSFAPQILGALAFFTLYFKVPTAAQKYRIALVAVTFVFWLGSSIVATMLKINQTDEWRTAGRIIGIAAAFCILAAYSPPAIVRKWLEKADARPTS